MIKNEARIELTGWLNNVRDLDWGRGLEVSVDVRAQNHQGGWETVDKTKYDVSTDNRDPLDGVKQVTVKGKITGTSVFQKRDGSTGFSIKVRADSVSPAANQVVSDKVNEAAIHEVWPTVNPGQGKIDEGAPF
jgi:hypothetical protein